MLTRLFHRLTAWLSDHWLNIRVQWHLDRSDPMREDQLRLFRPLCPADRPLFTEQLGRTEKYSTVRAAAHCVNCGHRGIVLAPDGQTDAELEGEVLDMLQCPVCGLYTMCSD